MDFLITLLLRIHNIWKNKTIFNFLELHRKKVHYLFHTNEKPWPQLEFWWRTFFIAKKIHYLHFALISNKKPKWTTYRSKFTLKLCNYTKNRQIMKAKESEMLLRALRRQKIVDPIWHIYQILIKYLSISI